MNTPYKIISELLSSLDNHPNIDMLISKPSLYVYIPNDQLQKAKTVGIQADPHHIIPAYFTRIPETISHYTNYLKSHTAIKIMVSKIKNIKDQKIIIKSINVKGAGETLDDKDIRKIAKKNKYFFDFFTSGKSLQEIPHAIIYVEKGILPSFTYKIIKPKPQTLTD